MEEVSKSRSRILETEEFKQHTEVTKSRELNGIELYSMRWKNETGEAIDTTYLRFESDEKGSWLPTYESTSTSIYFVQHGYIVLVKNGKSEIVEAGQKREIDGGIPHRVYIAAYSSLQVLRDKENSLTKEINKDVVSSIKAIRASSKAFSNNKENPKQETKISSYGKQRPDNGEFRYLTIGGSGIGDGSGCIIAEPKPNTEGAWQNSHFHNELVETYYVARGWIALAELYPNGIYSVRIIKEGETVTTKPGVRHNVYMSEGAVTYTIKHGNITPGVGDIFFESDEEFESDEKGFHDSSRSIPLEELEEIKKSENSTKFYRV